MKVYISTDLEGATGVFKFAQTREIGSPAFFEAMRWLMHDIAAVAEGLREAGVEEVYAMDGHDGGNNFLAEHMVPGVRYITGRPRNRPFWGLDDSFSGVILLGYHAMNGTPDGVLSHTQSSRAESKYWYDGVERGEVFQHALIAGHFDVPVILVTGDEAVCQEARQTLGEDLPAVAVKRGISREAAVLIAPEETRLLLREGARMAVEAIPRLRPFKAAFPMKVRLRRLGPDAADPANPYFVDTETEIASALEIP